MLPLVVILLAAGNRAVAKAWARWERTHTLNIRLWYSLARMAVGAVMLLWVIG